MKKQILIITGATIILILTSVWVYLLVFGTPKNVSEVFTDFGLNTNNTENTEQVVSTSTEETPILTTQKKLRQLTTKPIAGFKEINSSSTNNLPFIWYVEMGTGHIYSINLSSGEEKRVSATTVAGANEAVISTNGDYVAMGSRNNNKNLTLTVGKVSTSTSELILKEFSTEVVDFKISLSGKDLLYTTKDNSGLIGHSYNLKSGTERAIFNIPFHEATIQWGNEAVDTHYIYPKASYLLEGYLYKVTNGKMSRLPVSGFGLTALANDDIVAYTTTKEDRLNNFIFNQKTKNTISAPINFLPEKCIIGKVGFKLICAWEGKDLPTEFPDEWYKGGIGFKDSLWTIYGDDSSMQLLIDTYKESGRVVDITDLDIGYNDKALYFINKNDNTLWMYEL
jgi:hypothetical protein